MHWKTSSVLTTLLILAGFNFLAVAGGDEKAIEKAKKALQGTWTAKGDEKIEITFDGNKFMLELKGQSASGTYTIDPTAKPRSMDLVVVKATGDNTQKWEGNTAKAIYEIDGKQLKWLSNEPGKDNRPTAFPADEKISKVGLYVVFEKK